MSAISFVWMTLGVIIGGRLGYVLLYGVLYCGFAGHGAPACGGLPEAYFTDPVKIIAAWEGGMSFHGGLIGVADRDCGVLPKTETCDFCRSPI